jgi:hypothetical protein
MVGVLEIKNTAIIMLNRKKDFRCCYTQIQLLRFLKPSNAHYEGRPDVRIVLMVSLNH